MSGERIRVLHFLTTGKLAGTEISTCQVVQQMDKERFDVEVAFLLDGGPISELLGRSGIRVHSLHGQMGVLGAARRLLKLVRSGKFEIAHLYGFKTSLMGRIAFKTLSPMTVVIQGIRGQHLTETVRTDATMTRMALLIERALSPLIDHYVANSRGAIRFLVKNGLSADKFSWIPSGVDPEEFNIPHRNTHATPLIVCVARFHPVKRHRDIIAALERLSEQGIAHRSVFAGEGPQLPKVRALAGKRGLSDDVAFPGEISREGLRSLLGRADIFVLVSDWEGLPRSVMEAMAAGLPVVGTDVNGINELVVNGETGLLVQPRDTEALANALARLVQDREMRVEMGQRGQMRIKTEFNIRDTTRQLEGLYVRVTESRTRLSRAP